MKPIITHVTLLRRLVHDLPKTITSMYLVNIKTSIFIFFYHKSLLSSAWNEFTTTSEYPIWIDSWFHTKFCLLYYYIPFPSITSSSDKINSFQTWTNGTRTCVSKFIQTSYLCSHYPTVYAQPYVCTAEFTFMLQKTKTGDTKTEGYDRHPMRK